MPMAETDQYRSSTSHSINYITHNVCLVIHNTLTSDRWWKRSKMETASVIVLKTGHGLGRSIGGMVSTLRHATLA